MVRLVLHTLAAGAYACAVKYDYDLTTKYNVPSPVEGVFLSKFVWLTEIDLYAQFIYNVLAALLVLYEAVGGRIERTTEATFHRYATALIFPLATTVVILFWSLVLFDPDTLIDEDAKRVLSVAWFNHTIHTLPLVTVVLDHILWRHTRTSKTKALKIIVVFLTIYLAGVHYIHYVHNFWAYPILGDLDKQQRLVFIAGCVLVFFVAYLLGDTLLAVLGTAKKAAKNAKKSR